MTAVLCLRWFLWQGMNDDSGLRRFCNWGGACSRPRETKGQKQTWFSWRQSLKPAGRDGNSLIPYHCSFRLQAEKFQTLLFGSGMSNNPESQLCKSRFSVHSGKVSHGTLIQSCWNIYLYPCTNKFTTSDWSVRCRTRNATAFYLYAKLTSNKRTQKIT
jgi:hypothetical protein